MRSFLLSLLACSFLLAPVSIEARSFGGFRPGDSFTLRVASVRSTRWAYPAGPEVANPIPRGVPRYRKNQSITFRVRAGGKLTARGGINIPYSHSSGGINEYNRSTSGPVARTYNAEIYRKGRRATKGNLLFIVDDSTNRDVVTYRLRR